MKYNVEVGMKNYLELPKGLEVLQIESKPKKGTKGLIQ
jgi:hypothetical protein